ncbi:hypothetical protein JCM10207_004294 [Rhodosporidiobolus poonsookiae]
MLTSAALLFGGATLALADSLVTNNASSWWDTPAPAQSFYSEPDLAPPEQNRLTYDASKASDNYTFLSYRSTAEGAQPAPLIMDNNGSLVWSGYDAGYTNSMDLRVQQYKGEDVLTFFQGDFFSGGYGNGSWYMLSSNYTKIREVYSLNQTAETSDFHEFVITENNTALVESWRLAEADLTSAGGDGVGWTWDCVFQEIDISGDEDKLLFEWSSIEAGVSPGESYFLVDGNGNSTDNAFDSCHINAVEKFNNGNYLVSMRGPSTIYYIDGSSGEIIWRLSGKYTNFTMGTNATFWYQHDARLAPGSDITASKFNISLFDNAAGGGEPAESMARAIVLELDTDAMTATLVWEAFPSFGTTAASQGSHRIEPASGSHMVGWGATPYFTEYDADANIIHDAAFGAEASTVQSYRAFKQAWSGFPLTVPKVAVNQTSAYASWNGATDVASWTLLGGTSESDVSTTVSSISKSGFETEFAGLNGTYTYLAAAAIASDGTCLGVSAVYSTSSMASTSTNGTCPSGSTVAAAGTNGTSTASGSGGSSGAGRSTALSAASALLAAGVAFVALA